MLKAIVEVSGVAWEVLFIVPIACREIRVAWCWQSVVQRVTDGTDEISLGPYG
jgi:hypothetical protein